MDNNDQENNKLLTKVTSIAEEEEKTGQKIDIPSPEKLVSNAAMALINCRKQISMLLPNMSKKAINRAVVAMLDIPTDGIPVELKTKEEKLMFDLGQKAINSRFLIVQHHVSQQIKQKKEEDKAKEKLEAEKAESSKENTNIKENEENGKE